MRSIPLIVILAAAAACTDAVPSQLQTSTGVEAMVVHVSDGDSIIVEVGDEERRVRLIGINAPEQDECFGSEARTRLTELIEGKNVTLTADLEESDQYGRWLRYVFLDGELVNKSLVADGYVLSRSYEPNVSFQRDLDAAQSEARGSASGLWGACAVATDLQILEVNADAPGPDGENLNGEWVVIRNNGDSGIELEGWTIRDAESVNRYVFGKEAVLGAGDRLRLFTGCGAEGEGEFFWCAPGPVWNNRGDVAFLLDPTGKIADRYEY